LSFIKKLTWIVIGFGTLVSFSILLLIALIVTGRIGAIPYSSYPTRNNERNQ
jgi:hypothetical protein